MNLKYKIVVMVAAVALVAASCNKSNNNSSNTGSSGTSSNSNSESNSSASSFPAIDSSQQHVVSYTDSGFSPATLTITKGDTVAFENNASDDMRVASNPHPIHNGYPTTGGCVSSTFDACGNIPPGHMWTFEFDIVGSWGYHNHDNPAEGGTIVVQPKSTSSASPANTTPATSAPAKTTTASTPAATPQTRTFTVNANDNSADLTSISVKKGDTVKVTFNVDANDTYHGGLDFRSSQLSTGTIAPGSSKTISFTASGSFAFTPYWPASNIEKPYKIQINVS